MKRLGILFIIAVILLFSCSAPIETELTEEQKALIEQEIKNVFDVSAKAASNHDFETMMKYLWNNENFVYASNGYLIKGWDAMYNVASTVHSNPENQKFYLNFDEVNVKVINDEAVMVNGVGQMVDIPVGDSTVSTNLTVTFLMEKIGDAWLITAGHESTTDKVF